MMRDDLKSEMEETVRTTVTIDDALYNRAMESLQRDQENGEIERYGIKILITIFSSHLTFSARID